MAFSSVVNLGAAPSGGHLIAPTVSTVETAAANPTATAMRSTSTTVSTSIDPATLSALVALVGAGMSGAYVAQADLGTAIGAALPPLVGPAVQTATADLAGAPPNVAPPITSSRTIITAFQAGHGWTTTGGAAGTDLNDTTDPGQGTQSAKIVTDTAATTAQLTSPVLVPSLDMTGKNFAVLMKVVNPHNINSLRLYWGNGTLSSNYNLNLSPVEAGDNTYEYIKDGAWMWYTIAPPLGSSTGTPDRSQVAALRFSISSLAGQTVELHVAAVAVVTEPTVLFPNGVVSFTYDDGRISGILAGRNKLDRYGWAGTAGIIVDRIDSTNPANRGGNGTYASLNDLASICEQSKWEIAVHAYTAAAHDAGFSSGAISDTDLQAGQFLPTRQWLWDHHLGNGNGLVWPKGISDKDTERVAAKCFTYGRGIYSANVSGRETVPPADPMRLRAMGVGYSKTLGTLETAVDSAVQNAGWTIFVFHEVDPTNNAADSLTCNQSTHDALIDYVAGLTNRPAVLPISEVLRRSGVAGLADSTVGGDLSGTLAAPTVQKIKGVSVANQPSTSGLVLTSTSSSAANWQAASGATGFFVNNRITAGESVIPRHLAQASQSTSSGRVLLSYFTPEVTETITQLVLLNGSSAAGATPTLVRAGIYQIDGTSNGTLVASIPNDTTIFAAAAGYYQRSLSASWTKTSGQRYAFAVLVVDTVSMPDFVGVAWKGSATAPAQPPQLAGFISGQTDLPASFTSASVSSITFAPQGLLLR